MYDNSALPKLLAKENLTIRHGNYHTAWFDIKNRVLGLPMWKDMPKDVYDLFVGHEVGHALETPFEGWHDSPEKLEGCPRSYINVVEDARIERKVKARYPGLVGPFSRGYKKLFEDNFFGDVAEMDIANLKLIDKINLKAKIGQLIEVPFTDEEQVFMDRANTTQDFPEVLQLVKDILAYTKENEPEKVTPPQDEESNEDQNDDNGQEQDVENTPLTEDEWKELLGEEPEPEETESNDESESQFEVEAESNVTVLEPEHDESVTDNAFRKAEREMFDAVENDWGGTSQPIVINDVNKEIVKKAVISYSDLKDQRKKTNDLYGDAEYVKSCVQRLETEWPSYIKGVKRGVQLAVKEFEMRKAAERWAKAQTARTGIIDVNKLHAYKTNDDIFLQTTRLHNSKNHGMIMLVDYSGSMCDSLEYVLDQLIHLVIFCKQINIPFDVYAFTSTNQKLHWHELRESGLIHDGDLEMDNLAMPLICSSKLSKKDFDDSIKHMYLRSKGDYYTTQSILARDEEYGSTPLNQALIVSHHLVKEFKIKHQVEKMNFVVFSDGDANNTNAYHDSKLEDKKVQGYRKYGMTFMIDGKPCKISHGAGTKITAGLIENLAKRYNTNTIGFFMADNNRHWNSKLGQIAWDSDLGWETLKADANKSYRKNKCFIMNDTLGYNEFYLIKGGKSLSAEDDEFGVTSDQTKGQMANAFKKYSKSKKQNKVLMTTFGRAVA